MKQKEFCEGSGKSFLQRRNLVLCSASSVTLMPLVMRSLCSCIEAVDHTPYSTCLARTSPRFFSSVINMLPGWCFISRCSEPGWTFEMIWTFHIINKVQGHVLLALYNLSFGGDGSTVSCRFSLLIPRHEFNLQTFSALWWPSPQALTSFRAGYASPQWWRSSLRDLMQVVRRISVWKKRNSLKWYKFFTDKHLKCPWLLVMVIESID